VHHKAEEPVIVVTGDCTAGLRVLSPLEAGQKTVPGFRRAPENCPRVRFVDHFENPVLLEKLVDVERQ
jgi:hypothetical protein